MSIFNRGDTYRLEDREPEKKKKPKKQREVKPYKPLRPLSRVGSVLALLVAAAVLAYGAVVLVLRFAGVEAMATPFTLLDETGAVAEDTIGRTTSTLRFTFRDETGTLREGSATLLGVQGTIGDRVAVRYLPGHPETAMLSSRTENLMVPLGCLLLSAVLGYSAVTRFRQIGKQTEEKQE